jgi:hypothetical protein
MAPAPATFTSHDIAPAAPAFPADVPEGLARRFRESADWFNFGGPIPPGVPAITFDDAPEVDVEPLWPLLLLESAAVVLEVDTGIVVKPDVSVCDGWQASVSPRARKLGRDRGRMRTKIAEV